MIKDIFLFFCWVAFWAVLFTCIADMILSGINLINGAVMLVCIVFASTELHNSFNQHTDPNIIDHDI